MVGREPLRSPSLAAAVAFGILIGGEAIATSPVGAGDAVRLTSLIEQWFAVLGSQPSDGWEVENFLAGAPLEFSLPEVGTPGSGDLADWLVALRSSHPKVEFRLDAVRFDYRDEGLVRARFEFDRHALDASGLPHLARREQTWLIRALPGEVPVVLRIEEQRLLAFPGTGPQIVCY